MYCACHPTNIRRPHLVHSWSATLCRVAPRCLHWFHWFDWPPRRFSSLKHSHRRVRNSGKHQLTVSTRSRDGKEKNSKVGDNCEKKTEKRRWTQHVSGNGTRRWKHLFENAKVCLTKPQGHLLHPVIHVYMVRPCFGNQRTCSDQNHIFKVWIYRLYKYILPVLSVSTWNQQTSLMHINFWEGSQVTCFMKIHEDPWRVPLIAFRQESRDNKKY